MPPFAAKHILIAPLDWGLGHTTRCIPIIRHLLAQGHRVTMAGNTAQQLLIRRGFPQIDWVDLEGYNVIFGKQRFIGAILRQMPRLIRTIRSEHQWLARFVAQQHVDGIISDNRYGFYHSAVPSIMLTHQPGLKTGLGKLADRFLRPVHYSFLENFRKIWLVDNQGPRNLGGDLSHPSKLPANAQYIGLLSQMNKASYMHTEDHLLVLLSGPEPQRTLLEQLLWMEVINHPGKVIFVAGKATATPPATTPPHIKYHQQLSAAELQPLIEAATYIICRGGYSTLMDLAVLHKKAILIPTPGQAEQQYLATHLQQQGIFPFYRQDQFSLKKALKDATDFPFNPLELGPANEQIKTALDQWIEIL